MIFQTFIIMFHVNLPGCKEKPGAFEVALTRLPPEHYREVLDYAVSRWEANSQKDVPAKSLRTKGSSTAGFCWLVSGKVPLKNPVFFLVVF